MVAVVVVAVLQYIIIIIIHIGTHLPLYRRPECTVGGLYICLCNRLSLSSHWRVLLVTILANIFAFSVSLVVEAESTGAFEETLCGETVEDSGRKKGCDCIVKRVSKI